MTTASRALRTHAAFTLVETLVALAISALVIGGGVTLLTQWASGSRTLPVLAAREQSDAQVQQMIGELRSAVAVSYISSNEIVAAVTSNGSMGITPTINGTKTGPYFVAYYF